MLNEALPALLLIGPTGSGKTPLGDLIQSSGLHGRRCLHFDFGHQLRIINSSPSDILSPTELNVVRDSLKTGSLLGDEHFGIARKILADFICKHEVVSSDIIVLNGLPRHSGQAKKITEILDVRSVAVLQCTGEVILERIRSNSGGDRTIRTDDTPAEVHNRLKIYHEKTVPLIEHYRRRRVPVITLPVTIGVSGKEILAVLENELKVHF